MQRATASLRQAQVRTVERIGATWPVLAAFSAFALIAAITFGTSVHPF